MATPRSQGRMIRVSIAEDAGINQLSDGAARLYFMLKPHLNSHGKFSGGPYVIKENVVPLLPWSAKRINGYLVEINTHTSVRVWKQFGRFYVHDLAFSSEQDLRDDRKGRDSLPAYPGADRMKAGTSKYSLPELLPDPFPDLLPHEVEVEVKGEEEREVEVELEASHALPSPPPGGGGAAASHSSAISSRAQRDKGNGGEEGRIPSDFLDFVEGLSLMKRTTLQHALDLSSRGDKEAAMRHIKASGFNGPDLRRVEELLGVGVSMTDRQGQEA